MPEASSFLAPNSSPLHRRPHFRGNGKHFNIRNLMNSIYINSGTFVSLK